jgi:hypothetical protein
MSFIPLIVTPTSYFVISYNMVVDVGTRGVRALLATLNVEPCTIKIFEKYATSVKTKRTAFWNIAPCSLVEVDRRFTDGSYLHDQDDHSPNDEGSTNL